MSSTFNSEIDPGQPMVYQIRIKGHLGREWTDWFGGLTITLADNGETLLTGSVVDQAALHGVLRKVRETGPGRCVRYQLVNGGQPLRAANSSIPNRRQPSK